MTFEDGIREGERRQRELDVWRLKREARGMSPIVRDILLSIAKNIEAEDPLPPEE